MSEQTQEPNGEKETDAVSSSPSPPEASKKNAPPSNDANTAPDISAAFAPSVEEEQAADAAIKAEQSLGVVIKTEQSLESQPSTDTAQTVEAQAAAAAEAVIESLSTAAEAGAIVDRIDVPVDPTTANPIPSASPSPHYDEIHEPHEHDVLSGRGASVNSHRGNQHFRALCFARKPEFDSGNHAAKRRIATEVVGLVKALDPPGRFLKRKVEIAGGIGFARGGGRGLDGEKGGPWLELGTERAILKACQVMRDFRRPDRIALKEMGGGGTKKRQRVGGAEFNDQQQRQQAQKAADPSGIDNPFGVHDHDVLSGRGAFVNAHPGNQRFRDLALARKEQFDAGTYSEKRSLATEIVTIIRSLKPAGRFLKRVADSTPKKNPDDTWTLPVRGFEGPWEELGDDKAIHKACQVMRDLRRPDRMGDRSGLLVSDESTAMPLASSVAAPTNAPPPTAVPPPATELAPTATPAQPAVAAVPAPQSQEETVTTLVTATAADVEQAAESPTDDVATETDAPPLSDAMETQDNKEENLVEI